MNGISTLAVTFIIFILAKGKLGKYAALVQVRDLDNSSGAGEAGKVAPSTGPASLPELPKTPTIRTI